VTSPDAPLTPEDVRLIYREYLERAPIEGEIEIQIAACPTRQALLDLVHASEEYAARRRARGETATTKHPHVNTWRPEFARWTHPPGTVSADGIAVVGHEGWLFIKTGTNSTLAQHRGENPPPAAWLDAWAAGLEVRRREADALGVTLASLVVPDKLAIHEEQFPEPVAAVGRRPAVRLQERLGNALLYPLAELRAARAHEQVALRTDTHLTVFGNSVLAGAVLTELNLREPDPDRLPVLREYLTTGDLGARFEPQIVEVGRIVGDLGSAELVSDNREAIGAVNGHVGTRRVLRNKRAPDSRIAVLFGDSYGFPAAHYQGLGWWLAQVFRELHFLWVPFGWDPTYIRDVGASVAVVQTAERFVGRVPHDRVDIRALARMTIESGQPAGLDAFCRAV
jgi:hypothetical protein